MISKVAAYMREHCMVRKGDHVIAGVSGGADSVCLFLALKELGHTMGFSMSVIHIEHGIRGTESLCDMQFVRSLCGLHQVPFACRSYPVEALAKEQGISVEEAGRNVRYEAFKEEERRFSDMASERGGSVKTAVAHHGDDNAETMLFHLCRGSGLEGLAGIWPVRGSIIRPLLCVTRADIEHFLKKRGQVYRTDATNADVSYSRNRIRNEIMPQMRLINEGGVAHMNALAEDMRELSVCLRKETDKVLAAHMKRSEDGTICFDTECLSGRQPFLQRRIMAELLAEAAGSRRDISREHIRALLSLSLGGTGKRLSLSYGITAEKTYSYLYLYGKSRAKAGAAVFFERPLEKFPLDIDTPMGTMRCRIFDFSKKDAEIPKNLYTKWFDYGRIKNRLCLRTRKPGDYFALDRQGHRQKLKDYWMNEKVPREKRERMILLADGSHILWAIGGRISEYYKVTEHTEKILEVRYMEEKI